MELKRIILMPEEIYGSADMLETGRVEGRWISRAVGTPENEK